MGRAAPSRRTAAQGRLKAAAAAVAALTLAALVPQSARAKHPPAKHPVLVELFTAQGCSSCLKANAFAGELAEREGLTVLTWSVDYWDYLGWKDTFAESEFADRQRAFDDRLGLRDVYTPQVIVNGDAQASGAKRAAVETLLKAARKAPSKPPPIRLSRTSVTVGAGGRPKTPADVWLVRYAPGDQTVEVKEGDNRGRTVTEWNVVRQLKRLGRWKGVTAVYRLPAPSQDDLATLILVQGAHGGAILGMGERRSPKR